MDELKEIKEQIAKLNKEFKETVAARKRARDDGDENHELIYQSEENKIVAEIQELKNKAKEIEKDLKAADASKKTMPSVDAPDESDDKDEEKDDKKEGPEEPFFVGEKTDSKLQKMKEEYDLLNDMYLDYLEELEEKRQKMDKGEIPYEEYQKFSLEVIEKYKIMKDLYQKILDEEEKIKAGTNTKEPVKKDDKKAEPAKEDDKKAEPAKKDDKKAEPAKEDNKNAEPTKATPNKGIPVMEMGKDTIKIVYDAKNNVYNYEGAKNGKGFFGTVTANKLLFSRMNNKKNLIKMYGKQEFEKIFSGPTAKAYKKCDPHIVVLLYDGLGINACRDYLLELSQGNKAKKKNLSCDITYDLSGIKANKKLGFLDRLLISANANRNKVVAKIIPKLSKKALAESQRKLLTAAAAQYDAGELKMTNERTQFTDALRDFTPQNNPAQQPTMPDVNKDKDKGDR